MQFLELITLTCIFFLGTMQTGHVDGRRRRLANPSVEQCEREIQRLQASVDSLRHKLEESELKENSDELEAISQQSDNKIRSIIGRCVYVCNI